jgi:hypothetical protein
MTRNICSIDGCEAFAHSHGWCRVHYERWKRHGSPMTVLKPMSKRGAPYQWLLDNAQHTGEECLTWPFAKHPDGRAHMKLGRHTAKPARLMCEMAHGPAPSPVHEAAHSCGKGHEACVNPRHLRWATPAENSADKVAHGTIIAGERHYGAKLTASDVAEIRALKGIVQGRELAARFGVNPSCISKVQNDRAWKGGQL